MKPVTIYTKSYCGYSKRAKALLTEKGIAFDDIDVTDDEQREQEMVQRAGGKTTVPQVFIQDRHIGGYEDLWRLDRNGELEGLVQGGAQDGASP
jgi:glutaredoxin 3